METCNECNKGIVKGQFCEKCQGTGLIQQVEVRVPVKEEKVEHKEEIKKKK